MYYSAVKITYPVFNGALDIGNLATDVTDAQINSNNGRSLYYTVTQIATVISIRIINKHMTVWHSNLQSFLSVLLKEC